MIDWAAVAHAFDPNTQEAEAGASLSSRKARAAQQNPISKRKEEERKEEEEGRKKRKKR